MKYVNSLGSHMIMMATTIRHHFLTARQLLSRIGIRKGLATDSQRGYWRSQHHFLYPNRSGKTIGSCRLVDPHNCGHHSSWSGLRHFFASITINRDRNELSRLEHPVESQLRHQDNSCQHISKEVINTQSLPWKVGKTFFPRKMIVGTR